MKIRDLFASDVTRDIAPVVYFHEQSPQKLADEVGEYIITGGFPENHPNHRRVPDGIHEQYVRLLRAIVEELARPGGPDLPSSWISGFYGSGKSSFAKLLGLALDGIPLPSGQSLAQALLSRDTSPRSDDFKQAFGALRAKVDPLAVVFDIGGVARDNEHIHSAVVRQLQKRLGYCSTEPLVAEFELKLERDGQWERFLEVADAALDQPWAKTKDKALAEEEFSLVMSKLSPEHYTDPMSWYTSRAGTLTQTSSAEEATRAVADMLRIRAPGKTLFVVVDEVSQYIHQDEQRMLKLQSFVSELGQRLKGQAWLLVTGQQKLEESDETDVLGKLKGRFKPKLRVHLAATNIRDVVHKRLLHKTPEADTQLRELFRKHRNDLKLFAYDCEDITEEDFVEVYPMLPGHIDLLLQITSALRTRSTRSQGDDQAIRGLLQLLGELFRRQHLADMDVGTLVTLDHIYEVQQSALDSDIQGTMARILAHCAGHDLPLAARAARAVALLELIQETLPTDAELVTRCLFDRLDLGNCTEAVTEALEELRRANLLGYSEKQGYKIQSGSGEEWERERRDIGVGTEQLAEHIQQALKYLVSQPGRPSLQGRAFPWMAFYSDGRRVSDAVLADPRDPANVSIDLRLLTAADRDPKLWVNRSAEPPLDGRILWVAGESDEVEGHARELGKSLAMVRRYKARRESLTRDRQRLLLEEEARAEELDGRLRRAVDAGWLAGRIYFRGRAVDPRELGQGFAAALGGAGQRFLPDLYPNFLSTQLSPTELMQLVEPTLSAPSPKFVDELGILSLDAGKYVPSCHGVAPQRLMDFIQAQQGVSGATLLTHFGGPPYGYVPAVVRACVAGLLRAGKLHIQPDGSQKLTAMRDAGVRDVFEKDRGFKRASFFPAGQGAISAKDRARICRFFEERLGQKLDREPDAIADAVGQSFPDQARRLREVMARLQRLPRPPGSGGEHPPIPYALEKLGEALEGCYRVVRRTEDTVKACKRHLDALNDGIEQLALYDAELTDAAIEKLRAASDVASYQLAQLEHIGGAGGELRESARRIHAQLEGSKPWRDLGAIDADLGAIREAYVDARRRLIQHNGDLAEAARARIKSRDGFAVLTADQSHSVLRPLAEALVATDAQATSPGLTNLRDAAPHALERAEEEANERLDQILSEGDKPVVQKLALGLSNREIRSEAELDALLEELRARVLEQLKQGRRVRIV
ncbi:MAG: BREX system P-loop protein BrxC [Myxococcales bacterium]|nr:BREX system P-loop protein BrxC [Myxococcales bacterium]